MSHSSLLTEQEAVDLYVAEVIRVCEVSGAPAPGKTDLMLVAHASAVVKLLKELDARRLAAR